MLRVPFGIWLTVLIWITIIYAYLNIYMKLDEKCYKARICWFACWSQVIFNIFLHTHKQRFLGVYRDHHVRPSVCLSVHISHKRNSSLTDELISMTLYTVVVYDLEDVHEGRYFWSEKNAVWDNYLCEEWGILSGLRDSSTCYSYTCITLKTRLDVW